MKNKFVIGDIVKWNHRYDINHSPNSKNREDFYGVVVGYDTYCGHKTVIIAGKDIGFGIKCRCEEEKAFEKCSLEELEENLR